jgi:hypothetical protein
MFGQITLEIVVKQVLLRHIGMIIISQYILLSNFQITCLDIIIKIQSSTFT